MDGLSLQLIRKIRGRIFIKLILLFVFLFVKSNVQAQWEKVYQSYTYAFDDLYFLNSEYGFAYYGGVEHFLKTTDGFESFEVIEIPELYTIQDMMFLDTNRGFALGIYNNLYKTEDGGYNWERITLDYNHPVLFKLFHKQGQDTLYLAGNRLIRTTDGGETWQEIRDYLPFFEEHENTIFIDFKNGVESLLISSHNVYKPVDGDTGLVFNKISLPVGEDKYSLRIFESAYVKGNNVYLFSNGRGIQKKMFKSNDYGNTWNEIDIPEKADSKISGLGEDTVFIGGYEGLLFKSTDGFESWDTTTIDANISNTNISRTVDNITFTENGTAYLTSTRAIFKSEQYKFITSTQEGKENLPKSIHLKQNYPNPFNPTTNIQFVLSEPSNIELSVYNILGRKVDVLYNGFKSAGSHTLTFNASNLSGGIYFYELKTDSYTERKKMTLIK